MASPEMAHLVTSQPHNGKLHSKDSEILLRGKFNVYKYLIIRHSLFKSLNLLTPTLCHVLDHISLHAALGSLTNLAELHLTYQLRSIGVEYRRDQFQFTNNDAKTLARGLEKCEQLKILR